MIDPQPTDSPAVAPVPLLKRLDDWMASHPWHPRIVPFFVYILFLLPIEWARAWHVHSYPFLYVIQCGVVVWLLWRYRKLLPELTLKMHWLAVPVGVLVAALWIGIGLWMVERWPGAFVMADEHYFEQMSRPVRVVSLALRLLGMSLLVPIFEELFIRSLLLRSFHRWRTVRTAAAQVLLELPGIDDRVMNRPWAVQAAREPRVLGDAFESTPLGALSVVGVTLSTAVFVVHHLIRDWPAAVLCGVAYCLLLAATRHKGLGPVIWAHGLTNALIWVYTVRSGDWQFL